VSNNLYLCKMLRSNRRILTLFGVLVVVALLLVPKAALSLEQQDAVNRERNVERAFEYMGLGRESLLRGDYVRAVRILTVSINGNPTPEAFKLRGQAYDLLGNYDKALSDFSQYIGADPSNPSGYLIRADAHTFHGKHEKAIEDYSNAIRLDPSSTDAYLGRGIAYAAIERYEEAIRDLKKALSQQPENPDALYDTAVVYMLAKRPVDALSFLQKAVDLESDPKFKQESETLIAKIQKEVQASKATSSSPEFLETDLAPEPEPPAAKTATPVPVTAPQSTPEPVENITGDWETTYMGSRIRLQVFHHEGKVIKGVFRITNPVGKEDTYHFTGTSENGNIQGSHHSGQSFRGKLNPNQRLTGVLRTTNGQEIAVDFGLSKR
jgi:tetratricopeptide (TPR) repeat protein